jgi:hypothetical protein
MHRHPMQTLVEAGFSSRFGLVARQLAEGAATRVVTALLVGLTALGAGCKRDQGGAAPAPSGSGALPAPVASGVPIPLDLVSRTVNPRGEAVYSGPAGSVRGVVTVSGDAPPEDPAVLAKIGEDCAPAREVYGHLFREGQGRTLADVLVAVTGYKGYVPEQHSIVEVAGSGCAWSARTIAVTFGQRIDIVAKDRKAYVPDLLGAKMPAQLIALPGGAGSTVYAQQPGRYALVDSLRIYSMADVLVLKYATHDVTGLDGKFQIERIPAGRVTVSALLPATGETVEQTIEIQPSHATELKLVIPFDLAKYKERTAKSPASSNAPPNAREPSAPSSAAPTPSARPH